MITGSDPTAAVIRMRARGVSPLARAYSDDATRIADAPSTTPDELPAWWTWSTVSICGYVRRHISSNVSPPNLSHGVAPIASKLGASWASCSSVVPGRGNSS